MPTDLAATTTSDGATVPYIVRFEAGSIDRGVFNVAILHDPTREPPPTRFTQPKGWNRRISYVHGYVCVGGWYYQGTATGGSVLDPYDISRYLSEDILTVRPRPENLALSFNVLNDTWLSVRNAGTLDARVSPKRFKAWRVVGVHRNRWLRDDVCTHVCCGTLVE